MGGRWEGQWSQPPNQIPPQFLRRRSTPTPKPRRWGSLELVGAKIVHAHPQTDEARSGDGKRPRRVAVTLHGRQTSFAGCTALKPHANLSIPLRGFTPLFTLALAHSVWKARRRSALPFANGVAAAVGRTPLIKLKRASEETGCTILGKAEFMNPGQSVKDRAALYIIQDAVKRGTLRPGGTVVEGTAGNTGIGLTVVGNALGYHSVIVIPETQSQEKKDALRLLGAHLVEVPALPYKNPDNYVHYSRRLAEALAKTERSGAIWANQWDNTANRQAHIETTSEEIWADTDGKVDGFVSAVGSGGTLGGVSDGLKAKRKSIQIALADVPGAALYSYYTTGVLKAEGSSITEGIGQGRVTKNIEGAMVDRAYFIPDAESVAVCFQLLVEEGLCVGGSTGVNVAGAIRLAREMGPGHTIVTLLCDYGTRYQSKLFNPAFLKAKNLPLPEWLLTERPPLPRMFVNAEKA
jgi:cysteine synthase